MARDNYSLMRGGPVYRLLRAMGLMRHGLRTEAWIAAILVTLAMGPLLVLAAMNGTLLPGFSSVSMPLLGDFELVARFLVAMPLLILAAPICDELLAQALVQFSRSGIVHPVQRVPFDAGLERMSRLRDATLPEMACLLLALLPAMLGTLPLGVLHGVTDWTHTLQGPTPAGYWFGVVSTSLFRFVVFLWLWRFLLWTWLLWRLSRIDLDIRAAHPDRAGGLGFLGVIQQRFAVMALAAGALVSGYCMNHMLYQGESLHDLRFLLLGFVVASTLVIIAPPVVLLPLMLKAKRKGLLLYSLLGHAAIHTFDRRWLSEPGSGERSLLDSGDASAICDFTSVYDTVRRMAIVPVSRWNVLWIMGAAAVPLVPLAFVALSVDELLRRLADILL